MFCLSLICETTCLFNLINQLLWKVLYFLGGGFWILFSVKSLTGVRGMVLFEKYCRATVHKLRDQSAFKISKRQ